jgi:CheY-like chemotaxis protein
MPDELILIIEDNSRNLELVRDVLEFHGFRTLRRSIRLRCLSDWWDASLKDSAAAPRLAKSW